MIDALFAVVLLFLAGILGIVLLCLVGELVIALAFLFCVGAVAAHDQQREDGENADV